MRVVQDYVKVCIDYDNHGKNTKYVVQYMLKMNSMLGGEFGKSVSSGQCKTLEDIATVCGLQEYYATVQQNRPSAADERKSNRGDGSDGGNGKNCTLKPSRVYEDDFFYARPSKRIKIARNPDQTLPPDFRQLLLTWGESQNKFPRRQQVPQYQHIGRVKAYTVGIPGVAETSNQEAYRAAVLIGGKRFVGGWGTSKTVAVARAAHVALLELGVDIPNP